MLYKGISKSRKSAKVAVAVAVCTLGASLLLLSGCSGSSETSEALERIDQDQYDGIFYVDDSFVDEKNTQIVIADTFIPAQWKKAAEINWEKTSLRYPGVGKYQVVSHDSYALVQVMSNQSFIEIVGQTEEGAATYDESTYQTYYTYANAQAQAERYLNEMKFTVTPVSSDSGNAAIQAAINTYVADRVSGKVEDGFIDMLKAQGCTVTITGSEGSYYKRTDDVVNEKDKSYQSELIYVTTALYITATDAQGKTTKYVDWDIPFSTWYLVQPNEKTEVDFDTYYNQYVTVLMSYAYSNDLYVLNKAYSAQLQSELLAYGKTSSMKNSLAESLMASAKESNLQAYDYSKLCSIVAINTFDHKGIKNLDGGTKYFPSAYETFWQRDDTYLALFTGYAPGSYTQL